MEKDLNKFLQTLHKSIISWDYFVDFKKSYENVFKLKVQLNILNSLFGEKQLKEKFLRIVETYPETREALLVLVATRKKKIDQLPIVNKENFALELQGNLFDKRYNLKDEDKNTLWSFFTETGLQDVFQSRKIRSLEDYVFGVEVGLDSNSRKNRTGVLMEALVEVCISKFCKTTHFEYLSQATRTTILNKFGKDIGLVSTSPDRRGERRFDFALFDRAKNTIVLFEVNYYSSTGSKPSSIAREYIDLNRILKQYGVRFVWVTDGPGWVKMKNPLEMAINNIDWVVNLEMLKKGIFKEIFNF